jgi:hypothetical protein
LAEYGRIRLMADQLGLESIDRKGMHIVFKFRDNAGSRAPEPVRVMRLLRERTDLQLLPPASIRMDLTKESRAPSRSQMPGDGGGRAGAADPGTRAAGTEAGTRERPSGSGERPSAPGAQSAGNHEQSSRAARRNPYGLTRAKTDTAKSWWTTRATAGEVTPGFTKEEVLRPAKEDPRAPGGLFDRVGGVLEELGK